MSFDAASSEFAQPACALNVEMLNHDLMPWACAACPSPRLVDVGIEPYARFATFASSLGSLPAAPRRPLRRRRCIVRRITEINMESAELRTALRHPTLPWVLSVGGATHAPRFNDDFVDQVVVELRQALSGFVGTAIELNVYSAPWMPDEKPHGQLTLRLHDGEKPVELGLVFGAPDEVPNAPYRRFFDREAFEAEPTNPHACGIFLASFDECWLCCCRLIQQLAPRSVQFSFGA